MKYLVIQRFRSFGKTLTKGSVVDSSEIRSPYIRISEGKIVPAVSSLKVPVEFESEASALQATSRNEDKNNAEAPPLRTSKKAKLSLSK